MKEFMKNVFGYLQRVGRAFMLPVALLPAAGLLVGLGQLFNNQEIIQIIPLFGSDFLQMFANVISSAGSIIIDNLPLLFATGIAIGLCDGDGVAGLAAIVGFLVLNMTTGSAMGITMEMAFSNPDFDVVLGIPTVQIGILGGIISGVLATFTYKKFYKIRLPEYLGFFSGKRFVPIITSIIAVVLGVILAIIWPTLQNGLFLVSRSVVEANECLSTFIFGTVERALVPFGLHHIWYNPFWYQFGEYVNSSGQLVLGDQQIFFAQLLDNAPLTAGKFMTGKFPIMMFGLPGAALAMYHEAFNENKKKVVGLLMSAALASFLTGITEPIEFTFLFLAPILFAVHCVFAGFSFVIMNLLNVRIGMTFSGGLIDFLLLGVIPNETPWYLVILVGIQLFVIYYIGFRVIIRKLDLRTPGREYEEFEVVAEIDEFHMKIDLDNTKLAENVLQALGGKNNIKYLDACITRLRITVKDLRKVNRNSLKCLGVAGIMTIGNNIQAIFGPQSEILKDQIKDIIEGKDSIVKKKSNNNTRQKKEIGEDTKRDILIPITGEILELDRVPDDVFSLKLIGDGFAINPYDNILVSPIDGEVIFVAPTDHSITIRGNDGLEVFIHIGIDSIKLNGEGFRSFISNGDKVNKNQKLIEFPLEELKTNVKSPIVPIVFKNLSYNEYVYFDQESSVEFGKTDIVKIYKRVDK